VLGRLVAIGWLDWGGWLGGKKTIASKGMAGLAGKAASSQGNSYSS